MSGESESFGQKLRRLREERRRGDRRFSVSKLARAAGMSPTYLSKVERGDVPPPSEDKIRAMAALLGADAEDLLALAGRVPAAFTEALRERPETLWPLLKVAARMTDKEVKGILRKIEDGKW